MEIAMNKRDLILLENIVNKYGQDMVIEALNLPPGVRRKLIKAAVGTGLRLAALGAFKNYHQQADLDTQTQMETIIPIEDQIPNYADLVKATKDCMKYAVECIGKSEADIDLNPEEIVKQCYIHEYDLATFLAALWQESHMGTTPRAKKTGSPLSMGSYDNGKNAITYDDPNEAIADYIEHIQTNFQRGRTLKDTFQDGQLINGLGKRYAKDPKYESKIRYLRNLAIDISPNLTSMDFFNNIAG